MKKTSVGEYLHDTRLAKDLKVEQVSMDLNIPMQYITVMELNQFQFLVEEKLKPYLQAYGDYLGLDSDFLLEGYQNPDFQIEIEGEHEELDQVTDEESPNPKTVEPFTKWSRSDRFEYLENPKRRLPLVLMSLLTVLIIGLIGFAIYAQVSDEIRQEAQPSSSLDRETSQLANQETTPSSSDSDNKLTAKVRGSSMSVKLTDKTDQVTIEITQDSDQENLISVTNSDMSKKGFILNSTTKNATATLISGVDKSVITLASIDNVSVKINGENLDLSGLTKDSTSYITLTVK
ncbi:helix-turn-helix domain-containing protein [Streptococcus tangpeifui]|uniref:helix-turn-helix domain-containing protein n=1 Tax=Streptococcus tangpeifui TaxID=2709400 RepID=UPI0013EA4838|nr:MULTISPECIES: helix-turn-helix domain-containing protein [unclassified Streptococcus]